jgi:hypothetical protein
MTGEIRKVPYQKDVPGRPKNVKVHSEKVAGVEILGGKSRVGPVTILDSSSGEKSPPPEINVADSKTFNLIKEGKEEEE